MISELSESGNEFNNMKDDLCEMRPVDNLGRVVLPKPMRELLGIAEKDNLKISLKGNAMIVMRDKPLCAFCRRDNVLIEIGYAHICSSCAKEITEKF